jgi:hypothetical protein
MNRLKGQGLVKGICFAVRSENRGADILAGLDHENEILSAERETNALGGELGESRSVITVNSAAKKSEF